MLYKSYALFGLFISKGNIMNCFQKDFSILKNLNHRSKSSLTDDKRKEVNSIDLTEYDAIAYIGRNSIFIYSTYKGDLIYYINLLTQSEIEHKKNIKNFFRNLADRNTNFTCLSTLFVIEEDQFLKNMKKNDDELIKLYHTITKINGSQFITAAQYHGRFGFKIKQDQKTGIRGKARKIDICDKNHIYELFNHKCVYCNKELEKFSDKKNSITQIDHIVPIKEGGNNYYLNWALVCRECNNLKVNKLFNDTSKSSICKRGKKYLNKLKENYHFYKIKRDNQYYLVRKQGNFYFNSYFTIYKKICQKYTNRDDLCSGYQFIISLSDNDELKPIVKNDKVIPDSVIESELIKGNVRLIDCWLN